MDNGVPIASMRPEKYVRIFSVVVISTETKDSAGSRQL